MVLKYNQRLTDEALIAETRCGYLTGAALALTKEKSFMDKTKIFSENQLTREQAIAFSESKVCELWSDEQIVRLQLFQEISCVPFDRFHEAIKKVLKRDVYLHEFGSLNYESLVMEYLGEKDPPTLEEIINLIPEDKRILIGL